MKVCGNVYTQGMYRMKSRGEYAGCDHEAVWLQCHVRMGVLQCVYYVHMNLITHYLSRCIYTSYNSKVIHSINECSLLRTCVWAGLGASVCVSVCTHALLFARLLAFVYTVDKQPDP